MKISTKITLSTFGIVFILCALVVGVLLVYAQLVVNTNELAEQSQPALATLERLRTSVFEDALLMQRYVVADSYIEALALEEQLVATSRRTRAAAEETSTLIAEGTITNEDVISRFTAAMQLYTALEERRSSLIALQRRALATNSNLRSDISVAYNNYLDIADTALVDFSASIETLSLLLAERRAQLRAQTQMLFIGLIAMLVVMLAIAFVSSRWLILTLSHPLDTMIEKARSFTSGNYSERMQITTNVRELRELQHRMNAVFSLAEQELKENPVKQQSFERTLLPEQYTQIIDFVKHKAQEQRAVTMTDIKKQLSLTHPTVQTRLRYLEQLGIIELEKHGRQKIIVLKE